MKVVSERLGHATIAFTMQTYQHLLPGMQTDAAIAFERLAAPTPPDADNSGERRGNGRRKDPPDPEERPTDDEGPGL